MDIKRRALYNSLRMNWLLDPSLEVESWQVENYREMSLPVIFGRLRRHEIDLDKAQFVALAEEYDTPEDLVDDILEEDEELTIEERDLIYLLLFELWRRLMTEKPCLSVFCDELDHQIFLYDRGQARNAELIEDALSNLIVILEENTDQGADPVEVLESFNLGCANNVETFLYDFISEQIDNDNESYASELLDNFSEYASDAKWFDFLQVRLLIKTDPDGAGTMLEQLIEDAQEEPNLDFNLEVLSLMVQEGEEEVFVRLVRHSLPLLETEEDFQDLITICADFYRCLDKDQKEEALQDLLDKRAPIDSGRPFNDNDPAADELITILG
ncbi:MAG: hypothetical protein H7A37_08645 [Chlamydiales bacterium]|nr:hypothetical protein [Chlamydiia bacterium]MCP5508347.1 hypothetical protein [Chlamydiales bacterium]